MPPRNISVLDQPIRVSSGGKEQAIGDSLNVSNYATTLADFITNCATPLTIGIQGEWGSGKTSLLNMIQSDIACKKIPRPGRGADLSGEEVYKTIWINTWEHSLLKSAEECLLSILEEIIEEISLVEGSWKASQRAKSALNTLAKGALRVGATMALGNAGGEVANQLVGSERSINSVKELRNSLNEIITLVVQQNTNYVQKFIIFIDDLDRLEPSIAVSVLELLKNIFDVEHCVFVLAIDYQVVVKGLKGKFGEPTEKNEWEFRAFFDKIIQLPFMMPLGRYDVHIYLMNLLKEIEYFSDREAKEMVDQRLADVVKLSIGHNPRSIKRLINSLSLINNLHGQFETSALKELLAETATSRVAFKELIFSFVCLQITYPKIYELLLRHPQFIDWDEDLANKLTGPTDDPLKDEVAKALDHALATHEEDFDEEWEQALFKIAWSNNWQRHRILELSRLLSIIKDTIISDEMEDESREKIIRDALEKSAVTAVVSMSDETSTGAETSFEKAGIIKVRRDFWRAFAAEMSGSGGIFDRNVVPIKELYSAAYLKRKLKMGSLPGHFIVCPDRGRSPIIFEVTEGTQQENYELFKSLQKYFGPKLKEISGAEVSFRISDQKKRQAIIFTYPSRNQQGQSFFERDLDELHGLRQWFVEVLPKLESEIESAVSELTNEDV